MAKQSLFKEMKKTFMLHAIAAHFSNGLIPVAVLYKLQKLIVENAIYYEFADGTMGIRGAWVTPDPREIPFE